MCGIAGFVVEGRDDVVLFDRLRMMVNAQRHRGPDDMGLEIIKGNNSVVAFGHCRLSIIDTSPSGHQPMLEHESGCWITYNGEIYNYQELRQDLKGLGYSFRTKTDTEVLLKVYAAWGADCLQRLRGIFAFAIWDPIKRRLFCARDHLGVKPFYYFKSSGMLLFASEVRGLLASGVVPRKIDLYGLRSYLAYGSVQDPLTMVSGVCSLLPGHSLIWQNGNISIARYWQLPRAEMVSPEPQPDMFDEVYNYLESAVHLQMVADVPLGAFLSGGIDSTAIAALMKRVNNGPVKTFSVVFDETDYDERFYSRLAAKYIGTEHTELHLNGENVCAELDSALGAYDQPSLDGLNTYFVSKVTREAGLTVALSGLGGDELFGGYDGYGKTLKVQKWGQRVQILPEFLRKSFSGLLALIPESEHTRKLHELLHNNIDPYFISRLLFSTEQVRSFLTHDVFYASDQWVPGRFTQLITSIDNLDIVNRASALEIQTYMLSTLLRDTDQMSMAHALEVRVPFLDHKLVEYIFTLPGKCKIHSRQPKPLLTRAIGDAIPTECIFRSKMGFTLPFEIWLGKALLPLMEETFKAETDIGVFLPKGLNNIWNQFQAGHVNWSRVWALFVFCDWFKRHRMTL